MLRYTGHPLVDIGVATLTAFADKRESVTRSQKEISMWRPTISLVSTRSSL